MKEGAALSYSIFAVVQRDRSRVDVDESFASIPKESPHGFAPSASASALAPNRADYVVEGLEDEDMLQAALRASLETIPACPNLPGLCRRCTCRPSPRSTPQAAKPPVQGPSAPPMDWQMSDEFETESEGAAELEPKQLSMEIRKRRLARFGG